MTPAHTIPLVEMRGVSRRFGHITALSEMDFAVYPGEVVALAGDNGAGKSTLIKILTGVHPPTKGELFFGGRPVHLDSPHAGREIDSPPGSLSPVGQSCHGPPCNPGFICHWHSHFANPDASVNTLSGGERQSIAIGRAIHFGTRLLILDEAHLGPVDRRNSQGPGLYPGSPNTRFSSGFHHP